MSEKHLYNGVRLPKLPAWNREVYPYAWIRAAEEEYNGGYRTVYTLFACARQAHVNTDYINIMADYRGAWCIAWKYNEIPDCTVWTFCKETTLDSFRYELDNVFWSEFDMMNEADGSIYCPASPAPVPAGDAGDNAMVQGWLLGKRLAGMRGKQPEEGLTTSELGRAVLGSMILGG